MRKSLGLRDVPEALHAAYVVEQLLVCQFYVSVPVAGVVRLR